MKSAEKNYYLLELLDVDEQIICILIWITQLFFDICAQRFKFLLK